MNIETLLEELRKDETSDEKRGTYVAVKFSEETNDRLESFIKKHKIPNPIKPEHFHTTVIYSTKYIPNFKADGVLKDPWIGKANKLVIFKSQEGNNCLVILYDCKEAVARHNYIMDKYKATYSFDKYNTHITLSYDSGNFDPDSIENLSKEIGDIEIVEEYSEDLNLDWAKDKTKKKGK